MENTLKTNYLLEVSRHLTQQQIHIFNELVGLGIKHLENPSNHTETYKKWTDYVNQLDDSVKLPIVCRAGQEAIELWEQSNK